MRKFLSCPKIPVLLGLLFGLVGCASDQTTEPIQELKLQGRQAQKRGEGDKNSNQSTPQTVFTLRDLVERAMQNNPAIRAANYEWQSVTERYAQAVSLPNPSLLYEYPLQHAKTRADMQRHKLTLMQEIPFPTRLYWEGEIVKDAARIARLAYERTIRDVVAQVQRSFYELAFLEASIAISRQNKELLQHFVKIAQVEVAKGRTPLPDLMRAQSQSAQVDYDLVRLEELKRVEIVQLQALLDLTATPPMSLANLEFPKPQEMPAFQPLYEYAKERRQEILALAVELTKADHEITLAVHEYFPDLAVGFSWADVERDKMLPPAKGRNEWMLMFGLNLPLWIPKNRAKVREARFSAQNVQAMKKNLENELLAALTRVYYKATNARRLVVLYEKSLMPQAQQAMVISERWSREGKGTILGMLDAQSIYQNFSQALARAQADYAQSLVELAQLSGGTLPVELFNRPGDQKQEALTR